MTRKFIPYGICLLLTVAVASCIKDPVDSNNGFLRFRNATVHVANKQGSFNSFNVESNIAWHLTITDPVPDWVTISKTSGRDNESITVTATTENTTGYYRFANIVATPDNNSSLAPVRLTVVQYDSTDQVAHH